MTHLILKHKPIQITRELLESGEVPSWCCKPEPWPNCPPNDWICGVDKLGQWGNYLAKSGLGVHVLTPEQYAECVCDDPYEEAAKVVETHSMRFAGMREEFVRDELAQAIRKLSDTTEEGE